MQLQIVFPEVEAYQIVHHYENIPHTHEGHYQLTIPTHGTCHFSHESRLVDLSAGDMLVLHPSDRHCFHIGDGASVLIVIVKEEALKGLIRPLQIESSVRKFINPGKAKTLFQTWMGKTALDTGEWLAGQEAEAKLLEDVSLLIGTEERNHQAAVWKYAKLTDHHIARVVDYIQEHYAEPISVDELAQIALQSRYHFIRSFKSAVGMSPYQYVLHLRMEEAKRLLRETSFNVTEISYRLGFAAPSQFYRVFGKLIHYTPEQYRSLL